MPSSLGGVGPGPTLGQMQAAFLAQRLQQHRERQQQHDQHEQHGTDASSMMPPPMPREAKRRRSIATSTSADDFNLDIDESGRSTPLRSNSSGGSVSASAAATSTSRAASNPFAIDLDGPAPRRVLISNNTPDRERVLALARAVAALRARVGRCVLRVPVWKSRFYGPFALNLRVDFHAIDATPARWRGDAGSSPLDRARTAASSRREMTCEELSGAPTHWLISTQINTPGRPLGLLLGS